ncbi:MAG TPA: hypothetical protein DHV22_08695 [Xanthomarina gelatinilytica]|uniref:ATPase dynein-related AAA domain-containing protein n=1 Tax=Xanthomarina gelatinilytica TaxID=1137281 RepID=A0A3D6BR57_9FLAO|nr:hypothetical protein [Xanthomarina gelatinilytica]
MLKNLQELKEEVSHEIQENLKNIIDIKFSEEIINELHKLDISLQVGSNVSKHITARGKLVYIPNTWFYSAAKLQSFFDELNRYKAIVDDVFNQSGISENKDYDKWTKNLNGGELSENVLTYIHENYAENKDFVVKFIEDYNWWGGGKAIGRNQGDFAHSALLKASGLLNESAGFVSHLAYALRGRDILVKNIIDFVENNNQIFDFDFPLNRILYGAPGTGKSFILNEQAREYEKVRVTFHPDMTYGQFVGMYKPISKADGNIAYKVVPGPFLRAIELANEKDELGEPKQVVLIIEELNRSNCSAVFGDIFQLLDRRNDGYSEYAIELSNDLQNYVSDLGVDIKQGFKIPPNLNLWATMNSADQGVFPLDAAFKRRWSMEYVGIDNGETILLDSRMIFNSKISIHWNDFRKTLNEFLVELAVNEDKLIGPFFLSGKELSTPNGFSGKLVLYLWDDVMRHKNRKRLFAQNSLSEIMKKVVNAADLSVLFNGVFSLAFNEFAVEKNILNSRDFEE